ncbi:SMP-30/gluconolactonase/LRE family protein [Vannielia litorea]|uniref:SMP-30/gluconolactonase/LRE family protein n=1 Tax=Vannielia litorea TaxID=1217970 RepID=UPI001BCE02E5|nr:SMP-30/gluconolactonase/LRE family protein [Vannielia litorea]MBS8227353.1 SMP-30/gluconolactonase/LRE family protein [Vannielia litorea]
MNVSVFDPRPCTLGEGPLWHPERNQLFWFDILGNRLLSRLGDEALEWQFDEHVSAAGWVDRNTLLIASESQLFTFDLETEEQTYVAALESENTVTRSNDGRADPMGGFWIGTMGKNAEKAAGAIYRYYRGELRRLYANITVANSICFAPGGRTAYWSDTETGKIMRVALNEDGWPDAKAEIFVDLGEEGRLPDGSVTDCEGALWNAQWQSARMVRYLPDGTQDRVIELPAYQTTCPAFGGDGLATLYCTSAAVDIESPDAEQGRTFEVAPGVAGLPEPQVIL